MHGDKSCLARAMGFIALLQLATSCTEQEMPTAPAGRPAAATQAVTCQADTRARTLTCTAPPARTGATPSKISADVVLGGQGTYVQLSSSNVSYDANTQIFQADVTLQNLTALSLGTPDGSTVTGVTVFFSSGPSVTSGTGTVTVANADGTGTFTATAQPFFLYDEILQPMQVSPSKTWQWNVPTSVTTFTFQVLVDAPAPGPLQLISAHSASALPMSLLTITAEGLDPAALVLVRFSEGKAFFVDVPAIHVSTSSLLVTVPPYINPSTNAIQSGMVSVQLLQESATDTLSSNILTGFQIENLPTPAAAAGTTTLDFVNGLVGLAGQLQALIRGTTLDTPELNAAITTQINDLQTLAGQVQLVIQDPTTTFALGSFGGTPITVAASDLLNADRMIMGMLLAHGASAPAGSAAVGRHGSRPGGATSTSSAGGCQAQEAMAVEQALLTARADSPLWTGYIQAPITSPACNIAEAFNQAYLVIGGSAGVALGIMAFAGAPELALALPAAALLYAGLAGGGGLIAVGGALGQQTTGAFELVQTGGKTLDDALKSTLLRVLSDVSETLGTPIHLHELYQSAEQLHEAFTSASAPTFYTLSTGTTGEGSGSVGAFPSGPAYPAGIGVTLTATPDIGSSFSGWSGACSGTGSCVITMSGNETVVATFVRASFTLILGTAGNGSGTVSTDIPGPVYLAGTVVNVIATPNPGSTFTGWSGACSGTGSCVVTMDANKAVTATLTLAGPTFTTYTGTASGSTTETEDLFVATCKYQHTLSGTITVQVAGSGTPADPYTGTFSATGVDVITVLVSLPPGYCQGSSVPGAVTGTVSGSSGTVEASGSDPNFGIWTFTGGVITNGVLTGTLTIDDPGVFESPIVTPVTLAKAP